MSEEDKKEGEEKKKEKKVRISRDPSVVIEE